VADDRKAQALDGFYEGFTRRQRQRIEVVAMDMWKPYIESTSRLVPSAKIAFDKFHVAKHLGDAIDKVRKIENRDLLRQGHTRLVRTEYLWLQNPDNIRRDQWLGEFRILCKSCAMSESVNSKTQHIKRMACGFRNRSRFYNAIYLHLGGLDRYPTLLS
jgi:transposase